MDNKEISTEYATGDVQPPKNYRLPMNVLLLLVIFLGSLISALSFGGIRLFRMLDTQASGISVCFIDDMRLSPVSEVGGYTQIQSLGIHGKFLSEFEQRYFDLPQGFYIKAPSTLVPDLCTGDVLLKVGGEEVTNQDMLDALIESHAHGASLTLEIYRNGHYQTISAVLIKHYKEN